MANETINLEIIETSEEQLAGKETNGSSNTDDVTEDFSEAETQKTTDILKGYCLYKYIANRLPTSPVEKGSQKTVLKFLKEEATSNKDFSLSLIKTDLKAEQEAKLRDFIIKRLLRSTVYSSSGNLATLSSADISDKPVTCYYKLIKGTKLGSDATETTLEENDSFCSLDFLVCFVVSETSNLHLFQQELENYCKSYESVLTNLDEVTVDITEVFKDLQRWYDLNILYVCRCTKLFQVQLAPLINVGLLGETISIVGCEEELKHDINRFVDACSLSSLLSTPVVKENNHKLLEDIVRQSEESDKLVFSEESGFRFELTVDICEVCNDWAKTMVDGDLDNPVFLKQVMENYKLKVIQDMNSLKRLVREAETDHYALFRSYVFLTKCHSSGIVMEHIRQEADTSSSKDMCAIIKVLEEFIAEKGGFSKIRSN